MGDVTFHRGRHDVVEAQEAGHERGGRTLPDLHRCAGLGDASVAHHHDPVGQREGLALVVRDGEHRRTQLVEHAAQFHDQTLAQAPVELAERFVEHEQPGPRGERPCQRHPLLLTAGQRGDGAALGARQADEVEQLGDTSPLFSARLAPHAQSEGDIAADVTLRKELMVLEHESDAAPVHGHPRLVAALQQHPSGVRRLKAGDDAQQGGLAAAARPQHADDVVRGDLQIHRVERRTPPEPHGHVLKSEQGHQNSPERSVRIRSSASSDTAHTTISTVLSAIACP